MGKPAVLLCAVPVLHVRRNGDHRARHKAHGRLALLLIPALAGRADNHLPAALGRVVDVPVVAAARLKGHVGENQTVLRAGQRVEKGIADKILRISRVGLAEAENILRVKLFLIHDFHDDSLLDEMGVDG